MNHTLHTLWVHRFRHAWAGFKAALHAERNLYLHLLLTLITLALGCLVRATAMEGTLLVFSTAFVWMAELFNTANMKTAGFTLNRPHPKIELAKDVSAAAVLVASVAAFLIGGILIIPKLF